jgi:Holliday junction resolvase RusA-like endonuclease
MQPHQQTPDVDNLLKALLDAIHKQDCAVWSVWAEKRWSDRGGIVINGIDEIGVLPATQLLRDNGLSPNA